MLKKLRTIVYHVNDIAAAKKWYADTFDIEPYFDQPFYVGFDIGGFELGLDPDPASYKPGNHQHTYWEVDSLDDVLSKLESKGIRRPEIQDVGGGIQTTTFPDPFGNEIGLIQIS